MKKTAKRLTALLLVLILCLSSVLTMTAAGDIEMLDVSLANFKWSLSTLDGETIDQDSFPDKTLLFVFYSPTAGSIVSDLANREWADREDIQVIVVDAKNNSAEYIARFKEQYAPDCDNMIFALNGYELMWNFVFSYVSGGASITYSYCAVVQNKVLKYAWDRCSTSSECREVLAKVLGEEGTVITRGLKVDSHTERQIKKFAAANPASLYQPITYKVAPSLSGTYSAGVLSDETAQSAVNMLNQVRYIAGLDADVKWDDTYADYASCGTLLNYLNNELSHYPTRPAVLSGSAYDELYNKGYTGSSSSNIAYGFRYLNDAIINGWCADEDEYNIDVLGHRRWFLNLSMDTIGFGATGLYTAAHVSQSSWRGSGNYVAWPAQTMPVQYFSYDYPWSISLSNNKISTDNVTVKLVRRSDGAAWNFGSKTSDGDFYVDTNRYGSPACIIFRPNSLRSISVGDVFDVTVTFPDGVDTICLVYSVTFFDLNAPETNVTPGDVNDDGSINMKDVLLIRQSLVGIAEVDNGVADVNGDGEVNMKDVLMIRQYLVGMIDEFPA